MMVVAMMTGGSHRARQWATQRGWTLIELTAALAVVGLLTSMAWPAFDGLILRLLLHSTSMTVIQSLRTARHRAMAEGRAYAVVFDAAGDGYRVVGGAAPSAVALPVRVRFGAAGGVLGPPSSPTKPPPEIGVTFRQAKVTFLPDGTLSPGPGTIYLTGRGRGGGVTATVAISVTIAGHPRRYEWEGKQWRAM
jgi:prepilin-type N-terminal cleavage/methylation domain-containing protein